MINDLVSAYDLPVPIEQQQMELERQYRRELLEKKLIADGYDLEELERDNPFTQHIKLED